MAQFEEPTAKRLRERLSMILPIAQLSQAGHDRGEIIRVAGFEFIEKVADRALPIRGFIKCYGKFHSKATSILV